MTFIEHRCTRLFLSSISQLQLQFFLKPYSLRHASTPQISSLDVRCKHRIFKIQRDSSEKVLEMFLLTQNEHKIENLLIVHT